jgi:nucleotide-binding universal stress UspA family protein
VIVSADHDDPNRHRVVVGVDGSEASRAALVRARQEAIAHFATLEVVHAWSNLNQPGSEFDPQYGHELASSHLQRIVLETFGGELPTNVSLTVVNDHARSALLDRSEGAFTLVVGARGLGTLHGLVVGSVSGHLVVHAPCPVLVVHEQHSVSNTLGFLPQGVEAGPLRPRAGSNGESPHQID